MTVKFNATREEMVLIQKIVARAMLLFEGTPRSAMDYHMDIEAVHCNGNPLRLKDLLAADDFNLMHDVGGIAQHLDRETGELQDCFSPRFSQRP